MNNRYAPHRALQTVRLYVDFKADKVNPPLCVACDYQKECIDHGSPNQPLQPFSDVLRCDHAQHTVRRFIPPEITT